MFWPAAVVTELENSSTSCMQKLNMLLVSCMILYISENKCKFTIPIGTILLKGSFGSVATGEELELVESIASCFAGGLPNELVEEVEPRGTDLLR